MERLVIIYLLSLIGALVATGQSYPEGFAGATTIAEGDKVWMIDVSETGAARDKNATFEQIASPFAADPSSNSAFDAVEWAADLNITSNWADVAGTPNTLSGYGIADAYTQAQVGSLIANGVGQTIGDHLLDFDNPHQITVGQIEAATAEQGGLADSALQPGDDVNLLANAQIRHAEVPVAATGAAIQAAMDAAGAGGVVYLSPGVTYTVSDELVPPGAMTLIGYGATIKRADESVTTLSAVAPDGASAFAVSSVPAGWFVGNRIFIRTQAGEHDQNGHSAGDGNILTITDISGNVITTSNPVQLPVDGSLAVSGEFPVGATVVKNVHLIKTTSRLGLYGITFHGNRANNPSPDWLTNWALHISGVGGIYSRIIDCTFRDMPAETMIVNSPVWIERNRFYNINGSCVHVSTYDGERGVWIARNQMTNVGEEASGVGHAEGVITTSSTSNNISILDNQCHVAGNAFFAGPAFSTNDREIFIRGNRCFGTTGIVWWSNAAVGGSSASYQDVFDVSSNLFDRCGDIWLSGASVIGNQHWRNIRIRGNTLKGGRITIDNARLIEIRDNIMLGDSYDFPVNPTGGGEVAFIYVAADRVTISGNQLIGSATIDAQASEGIRFDSENDGNDYRFAQGNRIQNNYVEGFKWGIVPRDETNSPANKYKDCLVSGNKVIVPDESEALGISATSGWIAQGNEVIVVGTSARAGILAIGIKTTETNLHGNHQGPIILNNVIRVAGAGLGASSTVSELLLGMNAHTHNIVAVGNLYGGTLRDNTAGGSIVSGNIALPVSDETALDNEWQILHQ